MKLLSERKEKQLADDVRNGSHAAMKKMYDTWSGYLFALCRRYVPDKEAAEDILQDSFVKIFSSIDSFTYKGEGSLKAWMTRITVNEALQHLRKRKNAYSVEYVDELPDVEDEDPDISGVPASEIQRMIGELPEGYRTIFNLFVFEELPHKEIAAMLGISESTSASQFHRARKILSKKIREYESEIAR